MLKWELNDFTKVLITICSVIAAIGYVLIGNGLYDEAIKHFSLLLQVCFLLPNLLQTVTHAGSWMSSNQEYFLFMFCAFDAGWSRAGQCHLRQRYSIWKEKSTGEWWVASFQFHISPVVLCFSFWYFPFFFYCFHLLLENLVKFYKTVFSGMPLWISVTAAVSGKHRMTQRDIQWVANSICQDSAVMEVCPPEEKKEKVGWQFMCVLAFCGYVPSLGFLFFFFWLTLF